MCLFLNELILKVHQIGMEIQNTDRVDWGQTKEIHTYEFVEKLGKEAVEPRKKHVSHDQD